MADLVQNPEPWTLNPEPFNQIENMKDNAVLIQHYVIKVINEFISVNFSTFSQK